MNQIFAAALLLSAFACMAIMLMERIRYQYLLSRPYEQRSLRPIPQTETVPFLRGAGKILWVGDSSMRPVSLAWQRIMLIGHIGFVFELAVFLLYDGVFK